MNLHWSPTVTSAEAISLGFSQIATRITWVRDRMAAAAAAVAASVLVVVVDVVVVLVVQCHFST